MEVERSLHEFAFEGFAGFPEARSWWCVSRGAEAEIAFRDIATVGHDNGAADAILELSNIPRPLVLDERAERALGKLWRNALAIVRSETLGKRLGEKENIVCALSQSGHLNDDDCEAVVQIL